MLSCRRHLVNVIHVFVNMFAFLDKLYLDTERCSSCQRFRPFTAWDYHLHCPRCRPCTEESRCTVCESWSDSRWEMLVSWAEEKLAERDRKAKRKSSPSSGSAGAKAKFTKGKAVKGKDGDSTTASLPRPGKESQEPRKTQEKSGTAGSTPGQNHGKEKMGGHSNNGDATGPGNRADPGIQPMGAVPEYDPREAGLDSGREILPPAGAGNESQVPMF